MFLLWPERSETIHATHHCFICNRIIPWVGNVFGELTVSHGNEVDATITTSKAANQAGQVELGIQLQCPECGAVNQFKVLHKM